MAYRNPRGPAIGWQPSLRQRRWWAKMARCGNNFRRHYNDRFQREDQLDDGIPENDDDGGEAEARRGVLAQQNRANVVIPNAAPIVGVALPAPNRQGVVAQQNEAPVYENDWQDALLAYDDFNEQIPQNEYAIQAYAPANQAYPANIIQHDFPADNPQNQNARRRRRTEVERLQENQGLPPANYRRRN